MTDSKHNRCPRCGAPKTTESKGSLTQWISVCRCDLKSESPTEQAETLRFCATCGKRINPGRAGSLTQWILRGDICNCENPVPSNLHPGRHAAQAQSSVETDFELFQEPEPELEMSAEKFPVDRYKALELIGSGGSGQVYRCLDRILGNQVAIKLLLSLSKDQVINFQKEAKAGSVMQHAGLVSVRDFGVTTGGAPYMVMDFVPGISLDKYIEQEGLLSESLAEEIFAQIAEGLSYAHTKGIFHRDLKTSNIIISVPETGNPLASIIDFGVSSVIQELTISRGKAMVGTPAYMSPDQANGLSFDERSEIYSLGCVMFESLTGTVPFAGDTALATMNMHATTPPPSLSDRSSDDREISDKFESIVARCLEKNPDKRYQSMDELKNELLQLPADSPQPLFSLPEGAFESADARFGGRSNLTLPLLVLTAVTIIAVGLFGFNSVVNMFASNSGKTEAIKDYWGEDLDKEDSFAQDINKQINNSISQYDNGRVEWKMNQFLKVSDGSDADLQKAFEMSSTRRNVVLNIQGGTFSAPVLEDLRKRSEIVTLQMTDVDLTEVNSLALKNVTLINLTNCKFSKGKAFSIFQECPKLETLYVYRCTVDNDSFKALSQVKRLIHLALCNCSGITDGWQYGTSLQNIEWSAADFKVYPLIGFVHALSLPNLAKVKCEADLMTGEHFDELTKLPKLSGLILSGKKIIDNENLEKIKAIRNPKLQLSMYGPCFGLNSFKALSGHKWERLGFHGTGLTDAGLSLISPLDVAEVVFDEPDITVRGLNSLMRKKKLKFLLIGGQCPTLTTSQLYALKKLNPQCRLRYYDKDVLKEMRNDGTVIILTLADV